MDLARVPLGAAVRAGAAKPDVSTVEAFKRAATGARLVAVPGSTSGLWLRDELFPKLGIKVNFKMTPRGSGATAMVATGEADLAVLPVSEILHATGIDFVGALPQEIQFDQTFSAAIVAGSKEAASAKRLIDFLASERAAVVIRKTGMEPLGKRAAR